MEFKDRLKQYRQDNNLTQDELAEKLYITRQAVSKYETGRGYPSIDVMTKLAELMGISLDELMSKEELAKQTIYTGQEVRKNKRNIIIAIGLIFVVIIISVVAIVLSLKSMGRTDPDDGAPKYDYDLVGIVGTTYSVAPDVAQLKSNKLFGYCYLYDETQGKMIGASYNVSSMSTQVSEQGCYYDASLLISKRQRTVDLYEVYYNAADNTYKFSLSYVMDLSLADKFEAEFVRDGFLQKFVIRFITVDALSDMSIYEYGMDNAVIKISEYDGEGEYTISPDCLFLVIEEKFEDGIGQTYYNRTAIFNSQIDNRYFYTLKMLNNEGYGDRVLIINKY